MNARIRVNHRRNDENRGDINFRYRENTTFPLSLVRRLRG